jgi:hypothetical protein
VRERPSTGGRIWSGGTGCRCVGWTTLERVTNGRFLFFLYGRSLVRLSRKAYSGVNTLRLRISRCKGAKDRSPRREGAGKEETTDVHFRSSSPLLASRFFGRQHILLAIAPSDPYTALPASAKPADRSSRLRRKPSKAARWLGS